MLIISKEQEEYLKTLNKAMENFKPNKKTMEIINKELEKKIGNAKNIKICIGDKVIKEIDLEKEVE